jgi:hypothetical protein
MGIVSYAILKSQLHTRGKMSEIVFLKAKFACGHELGVCVDKPNLDEIGALIELNKCSKCRKVK